MQILIVEDDPRDVEVICSAMGRAFGQVLLVTMGSVPRAIDYLRRAGESANRPLGDPSVIFLDLRLDGSRGSELIRMVRTDDRLAHTPIVMLTDSEDPEDIAECYRLGANAYISKTSRDGDLGTRFVKVVRFWTEINQVPHHPVRSKS